MKKIKKIFLSLVVIILILFVGVGYTFLGWQKPFHISSGAMIPTLLIGDDLLVSKTAYQGTKPKLGDVVAFSSENEPNVYFINRVVGLPGDRIQMKGGILHINDIPCPVEPHGTCQTINDNGTILTVPQFIETLPNGFKHLIIKQLAFGTAAMDETSVYIVPEGHYFMMGDNRDGSNDSRAQGVIGYIPLKNFLGQASFVYFSTGGHIAPWEFWKWPFTAHYNRILKVIN